MRSNRPAKRVGLIELLETAAQFVDDEAECLKSSTTCKGRWVEQKDLEQYGSMVALAAQLRRAAKYWKPNPLGGPARVYDAIADCIRAGDPIEDVLREYGLQYIRKPTTRSKPHAQHRRHP